MADSSLLLLDYISDSLTPSVKKYDTLEEHSMTGVEIVQNVFIGDERATNKLEWLAKNNIKSILNIGSNIIPQSGILDHYKNYKRIILADDPNTQLIDYFEEIYEFVDKNKDKGGVLIHCVAGRSRSATALCAYLIKKNKWSVEKVLEEINKKRYIKPNTGFMEQLKKWEKVQLK